MKTRRGHIQPRKRYFVGCEGESEQSYVRFLQEICDDRGLHVHLLGELLDGGDALARLEAAERRLPHLETRGVFSARFALLDTDQRRLSPDRAVQADRLAARLSVNVIWQRPCHEALLAKHFVGAHRQPQTADEALAYLQEFWPDYHKAMTAIKVSDQIDLAAAIRCGDHVPELRQLLARIGLI
ncbi:MAG: hypothetical protein JF615_12750 [Asticcacaulis sp.]|nr:hypothetical protein [Asticcacaulis sp.]